MIGINGMAHVILTVSRFDLARAFYGKLLRRYARLLRSLRLARPRSNDVRLIFHGTPIVRKSSACEMSQSTVTRGSGYHQRLYQFCVSCPPYKGTCLGRSASPGSANSSKSALHTRAMGSRLAVSHHSYLEFKALVAVISDTISLSSSYRGSYREPS